MIHLSANACNNYTIIGYFGAIQYLPQVQSTRVNLAAEFSVGCAAE